MPEIKKGNGDMLINCSPFSLFNTKSKNKLHNGIFTHTLLLLRVFNLILLMKNNCIGF